MMREMGRILAAFVVAASLLTLASFEASAVFVCSAIGWGGRGTARDVDLNEARRVALRRCYYAKPVAAPCKIEKCFVPAPRPPR
jgi:hypothetical protein